MLTYYLITALHVIVCIILILVVLLQSGKGADLAGAFGGGATQTAFGSRGPASFLSKLTTVAAVIFMVTSLSLALIGTKTQERSIMDTTKGSTAPAPKAPAAAQPVQAPPTPEQINKQVEEIRKEERPGSRADAGSRPGEAGGGSAAGPQEVASAPRRCPLRVAAAPAPQSCRSGGTGRHAILRGWWGNPWGFESPLRHQQT